MIMVVILFIRQMTVKIYIVLTADIPIKFNSRPLFRYLTMIFLLSLKLRWPLSLFRVFILLEEDAKVAMKLPLNI